MVGVVKQKVKATGELKEYTIKMGMPSTNDSIGELMRGHTFSSKGLF